jgi:hypothetical protein
MEGQAYNKILLPFNFGLAIITQNNVGKIPLNFPRSYDGFGKLLIWYPSNWAKDFKKACDLENNVRSVDYLSKHFKQKATFFHANWVCNEVLAKLFDIPLMVWIKKYGIIEFISDEIECENKLFKFEMGDHLAEFIYVNYLQKFHLAFGVLL